jgi:DNA polymerase-1
VPLPDDLSVHLVTNIAEAKEMLDWVVNDPDNREVLAYDLETTGLDPREDGAKIRLAQLGDHKTGWAIPWEWWSGVYIECLNAWEGQFVGHNTSFDNLWLLVHANWIPPFERLDDTMIMAQICEPDRPAGLKDIADRHIDRASSVGQQILKEAMKKQGWDWSTVPVDFETYWVYGCIDTVLTAHIWSHFRADLAYPEAYALEINTRRVVSAMENNGIRVDVQYCQETLARLQTYVAESKKWAVENWGTNIFASGQVVSLFQDRLHQVIERQTAGGSPSVDKVQLEEFSRSEDPTVAATAQFIIDVKNADKKGNSYFKNFLNFHHDGILHTSVKTMQARTGRMSSTRPAMQTISKGDTVLRDAFLPHEGQWLLSCDYSQVELRLMCHFSEDPALAEAFRVADATNGDFFVEMGKNIYKEPDFNKKDPRRGLIKNFTYSFLYGAGISKMAITAKVPESEIREFVSILKETYPGISEMQNRVIALGEQRERTEGQGYVITPFGRRIPCDKGQARTLVNYLIQGHAAEILKRALVRMDAAGLTEYLLLPIHDEVIASVPPEEYEDVSKQIGELMSVRGEYAVDLIAEAEGPFARWGHKLTGKTIAA